MKALHEVKEHNTSELKVTVDGEVWEKAVKKVAAKAVGNLEVKGFRKGKVPANLVEKYINRNAVLMDAAEDSLQEALNFAMEQYPDIRIVDQVRVTNVENVTEEGCEITFEVTTYPEVKLGDYKAIKYSEPRVTVKKTEVEEEINKILEKNSDEVLKEEGTIENGNIAVIDFEGFVDGVAFEGGKGEDYPLEIGSHSFVDNFEDQLIGMAAGEEKDVNVTFPQNYTEELAGKAATFKVKVNGIKEKKLPELTDEFVEELKYSEDVHTVAQLNDFIKEKIKSSKKEKNEEEATNKMLDELAACCEVEIPECMIDQEVDNGLRDYENNLAQQGFNLDFYYKITGSNEETLRQQLRASSENKVKMRILLDAVGKDMNTEVSQADIEEQYNAMAAQYDMEADKIKELVPEEYIRDDIFMQKTLENLKKQNQD